MRIIIIEDETAAAVNLRSLIGKLCPEAETEPVVETISDAVKRLGSLPRPDLILMDIHLADGNAFRIFEMVEVESPVVFTTAYDRYALEAFRVNSIDYLLKPIKQSELQRALDKFAKLTGADRTTYVKRTSEMAVRSKSVFLIHVRDKIIPVRAGDIAFFHTADEKVSLTTHGGETMPVEGSLDTIMNSLSQEEFFRANRQFIISRTAIKDISIWFGSRLSLQLDASTPERIVISKARVPEFKRWLGSGS